MGCGSAKAVQVHPSEPAAKSVVPTAPSAPAGASSGSSAPAPRPEPEAPAAQAPGTQEASAAEAKPAENVAGPLLAPEPAPPPGERRKKPKSLVKAVKENNIKLMDELVRAGASIEEVGMWDNTPLLAACSFGHSEAALWLVSRKANIWAKNEHGATPLHYAAVEGEPSLVEALVSAARSEGGDSKASDLVGCGPSQIYNRHLDAYSSRTPLCSAAESGFPEIATTLIGAGASVDGASEDGRTALWLAARHGRTPVAKLLLQAGADASAKDAQGTSVLEAAAASGNEELVLALLAHGVGDVNDTAGSPLREAVRMGKRSIAEALLTHGAAVTIKAKEGGPAAAAPLHAACERGDEYLVALLVRARADPSAESGAGQTAFDLLRRRGLPDGQIVSLLSRPSSASGGDGCTGGAATGGRGTPEAAK